MRMIGKRAPGKSGASREDGADANKASREGSNLEGDLVSGAGVGSRERSGRKLHHLRRRAVDPRCTVGTEIAQRADHLPVAVEKCGVDGERHEEGVDRIARVDGERVALRKMAAAEKPAHPVPDSRCPLDAFREDRSVPAVDEPHALTSVTRGPRDTSTLRAGGKI